MKYRCCLVLLTLALSACGGSGGGGGTTGGGGVAGGGTTGGGTTGGTGGGTGGGTSTGSLFAFDTGVGGSGGLIGQIDEFGSIWVNGLEMQTDDADFYVEGESGSESDLREGHYVVIAGDLAALEAAEVYYRSNLKGPVSATPVIIDLLTGKAELRVLGQMVLTTASTRFDGLLLVDIVQGDELEVSGSIDSDGQVIATYVARKNSLAEYKAIGIVENLDAGASTFELGGLMVSYSSATLSEFEGASLTNGQLVEVRLASSGFTPPATVIAEEVELLPEPEIEEGAEVEIQGFIDQFVSATSFFVGGVPVTTNSSTSYENGTVGSLGPNVKVEVEGIANASGVIVAEEIEFKSDDAIRVEGVVTSVSTGNGISGSVGTQLGITFEIRASTELEDDRDGLEPFTLNDLMIGDRIEARGFLDGTSVVAVELEREDPDTRALLRGPVSAFDQSLGTVTILGNTVSEQDGVTEYEDADDSPLTRAEFYNLLQLDVSLKAEWDDFSSLSDIADSLSLEDDD